MGSRDRQRNRNNRKSKRVILVAYEGKNKTERNYFNSFKSIEKDYTIRAVPGNETDPVSLVKQTIEKIKESRLVLEDDDRAFCIFDTDVDPSKNTQIREAIELAQKNNIKVITSSPCIETWFLLHYEYTTSNMNNNSVIKRLKKHYPKYSKNCNMYPIIVDKTRKAYDNAKKLEQYQKDNNKYIQSVEANPHSDIYQIIDELEKN